jgi:hypothetical protein
MLSPFLSVVWDVNLREHEHNRPNIVTQFLMICKRTEILQTFVRDVKIVVAE